MRGCRCCGEDGFWLDFSRVPGGATWVYSRTPWSRTFSVTLFGRELVVGHFPHLPVGLVDEEVS